MSKHSQFAGIRPIGMIVDELFSELNSYKLTLSTGSILGHDYFIAKPEGTFSWFAMEDWCTETFGPTHSEGTWHGNLRWYMNDQRFWFRDAKDRDWFVLRWS